MDKIKYNASQNTDEVINEVIKVRALLKLNPKDKNMQALMLRLNEKLALAYSKEQKMEVTNPLRSAVDLMALSIQELERFMVAFEKIDKEKKGTISFDQLFEFLELTPNAYAREIFYTLDSLDEEGFLEFGDFVRGLATYCFFGKEEILRFMFKFADKDKCGFITYGQFVTILNVLNPFDKKRSVCSLSFLYFGL